MLISFAITNFKTFRDRTVLRMDAAADTDLPEVVRTGLPLPDSFYGVLPVASIHGANAAGKSNIIKAAKLLDSLVDMGTTFPDGFPDDYPSPFHPARQLEPFLLDEKTADSPTQLEVMFLLEGVRWLYGICTTGKKIHSEWLTYWPKGRPVALFARGNAHKDSDSVFLLDRSEADDSVPNVRRKTRIRGEAKRSALWTEGVSNEANPLQERWSWGDAFEGGIAEAQVLAGRTRIDVPFLSVAAFWNQAQAQQVLKWFSRFRVMDATQQPNRASNATSQACNEDHDIHEWVERWMRAADVGISAIQVQKDDQAEPRSGRSPYSTKAIHTTKDGRQVAFDMQQESHGTIRLFGLAPTLYRALKSGGVLFVNEIHSGLHSLLLRALVKLFQSKERNPNNAQLIFTTHDVSVLDNSLLRRDQMHIVEKSQDGSSELFSISECDDKPRKNSPLIKYYLAGHLGGVPDLDLDLLFPKGK